MNLCFVPTLLGALQLDERIVQAPEPRISLAGAGFGFGQGSFERLEGPIPTMLPMDGEAASHLSESRLFRTIGPLCPALKKCREAGPKRWEVVSGHDVGQLLAVGGDGCGVAPKKPKG